MRPLSTLCPAFPTEEVRRVWCIKEKEEDVFVTEAATVLQEAAAAAAYYPFVRVCACARACVISQLTPVT